MTDDARDRLLASYAEMGEAMVIQNVLESEGIACRVGDLDNLPAHTFGILGWTGRSVGIWVAERDVERAKGLLVTLGSPETGVDEEALAAEALRAAPDGPEREAAEAATTPRGRPLTPPAFRAAFWAAAAGVVLAGALLVSARCG
jgi:hypothetical protein